MEVLASNIANADTPGYQAKDIDFKAALEETQRQMLTVQSTNKSHLGNIAPTSIDPQIAFRPVSQNAMDRNTVISIKRGHHLQLMLFVRNSL